jgi:hypothetical protein
MALVTSRQKQSVQLLTRLARPPAWMAKVPFPLLVAVYMDSFTDGFLIGISAVSGVRVLVIRVLRDPAEGQPG